MGWALLLGTVISKVNQTVNNSRIQAVMEAWTRFCETVEKCVLICAHMNWEMLLKVGRKDSYHTKQKMEGNGLLGRNLQSWDAELSGVEDRVHGGTRRAKEKPRAQLWKTIHAKLNRFSSFGQQVVFNQRNHGTRFHFTKIILVRTYRYHLGGCWNKCKPDEKLSSRLDLQIFQKQTKNFS